MKKIRIGQYGIGHNHGEEKMKSFRRFPELFEVVGVCEPDEKWRAARGALPGYADLRFLTEEEFFSAGLDAALVETDVPDLDRAAKKCLDHGLHIHMDKPGGEDIAEFTDVVNTARDKGLILQMGYMYRYNPVIRYAIDLAKSGALGEIFEIDTQMSTAHPAAYREWLSRSFRYTLDVDEQPADRDFVTRFLLETKEGAVHIHARVFHGRFEDRIHSILLVSL